MPALSSLARKLLPASERPRTLRFGIAKGAKARIDFRLDAAFYFGRHEPHLFAHYRRLLKAGMRSFDLGMYRGWDALTFSFLTNAPVVSFDCNAHCLDMSRRFLAPSGADITLARCYVSDESGETTLDEQARKYFVPDFIKIDVEGAEAHVLRGARDTLRTKPSLVIETHNRRVENECLTILVDFGYKPIMCDRTRMFSEARGGYNRWIIAQGAPQ